MPGDGIGVGSKDGKRIVRWRKNMDNEEKNYDNGGWMNTDQSGTFDSANGSFQTSDKGDYDSQSQNDNNYYNQPQDGGPNYNQPQNSNDYYNQPQNSNDYYNQPQNSNDYYNQPQNSNDYYNQPQNGGQNYYNSQPGDGFTQTNDSFNSVNNQGYNNYVPEPEEGPGFAIAGMVCGILSMVLCCCQIYLSGALAVIGLVFSIIVLKNGKPGKGMAIAGVVCSAIGIIIALFLISTRVYMLTHPEYVNNILDIYRQNGLLD